MRECAAAPPAVPEATSELQGDEGTVHLIRVRVRVRVGVGVRARVGDRVGVGEGAGAQARGLQRPSKFDW